MRKLYLETYPESPRHQPAVLEVEASALVGGVFLPVPEEWVELTLPDGHIVTLRRDVYEAWKVAGGMVGSP